MPAKKKPFRVLQPVHKTTRFTREEARRAVIAVMLERGELTVERANELLRAMNLDGLGEARSSA